MARSTALALVEAPRAVPGRLRGSRGIPERVVLDVTDALAPCIEAVALCDDMVAGVARITAAAMAGSRMAVMNEANRLGYRALRFRSEFRRMAAAIEDPDGSAA